MADVENLKGNLLTESTDLQKETSQFNMQFPMKINLSAPAAQDWVMQRRQKLQPWTKFIQTTKFQSPTSANQLGARIISNIDQFQSNYLCIFIILIFYCLITSPLLLFAVGGSLGACHLLSKRNAEKKIVVAGHELSLAQQYGLVSVLSCPIFYLAGAGAVVFWVLGASMFFIVLHASFYNGESLQDAFEAPIQQEV